MAFMALFTGVVLAVLLFALVTAFLFSLSTLLGWIWIIIWGLAICCMVFDRDR